jgi:hypothetical protein
LVELLEGVAEFGGNGLSAIHGKNSMPYVRLVVKGYLPPPIAVKPLVTVAYVYALPE